MPEVVIPLANQTTDNYVELRFALRSIAEFIPNAKITIIGGQPKWIKGVTHVPGTDSPDTIFRERNIFRKLLQSPHEDFIYANDDHFLLGYWTGEYLYEKRLEHRLYNLVRGSIYRRTITNTLRYFPKAFNFDIHCPMTISLSALQRLCKLDWNVDYGYCLKSVYCSMHSIEGTPSIDLKIRQPIANLQEAVAGKLFFSTADNVMDKSMISQFKEIYSHKSPWE